MKRQLSYSVFFFLLLTAGGLQAKPVSSTTALGVAKNFLQRVDLIDITPSTVSQYYIFAGADGYGFAIVAADDLSMPILAYSTTSTFSVDNMAPATESWLTSYARQIDDLQRDGGIPSPMVVRAWAEGHSLKVTAKNAELADSVPYLITTTWNQRPLYNNLCPYDSAYNEYVLTGCGATAMAQVMKYWNHPTTGYGSHSYGTYFGTLSADFGATNYQWDSMPAALTSVSSEAQITAVATLMKDVGIAIEMNYHVSAEGGSWSSIYDDFGYPSVEDALNRYFKYHSTIHHLTRWNKTEDEWENYLKADLSAGRPIVYRAADDVTHEGHIFVCDGYDAYGAFHFNWGWGGYGDGYYYMGALNPDAYSAYNTGHSAVLGIAPDTAFDSMATVMVTTPTTSPSYGYVHGGGTYSYGDTVVLLATANNGYRFVRWADGVPENPRTYRATNNRTDSAIFVPMTGDTLGYSNGYHYTSYGYGSMRDTYWGIKLPVECFESDHVLSAIQVHCESAGEDNDSVYYFAVYSGGDTLPQTLLYFDTFVVSTYGWATIPLDSLVAFDHSKPLWILLHSYGKYVVCVSSYSGNSESFYWNGNNGNSNRWFSLPGYGYAYWTCMLRAVMDHGQPHYTVTTAAADTTQGTTSGDGSYQQGTLVTITAIPNANYHFTHWNDDTMLTANPYTFTVTEDCHFVAHFEADPAPQGVTIVDAATIGITVDGLTLTVDNPTGEPLSLYDLQGRQLSTFHTPLSTFTLPAPGVYLLKSATTTQKIVAQ